MIWLKFYLYKDISINLVNITIGGEFLVMKTFYYTFFFFENSYNFFSIYFFFLLFKNPKSQIIIFL